MASFRLSLLHLPLLLDHGEEIGAGGGNAVESLADAVAGGVEGLVEAGEEVALLRFAGLGEREPWRAGAKETSL